MCEHELLCPALDGCVQVIGRELSANETEATIDAGQRPYPVLLGRPYELVTAASADTAFRRAFAKNLGWYHFAAVECNDEWLRRTTAPASAAGDGRELPPVLPPGAALTPIGMALVASAWLPFDII